MKHLIDKLAQNHILAKEEFSLLLSNNTEQTRAYISEKAVEVRQQYYGTDVFIRGLIEISNYCKNDCLYCGIRRSNSKQERYRLTEEQILSCCNIGYELGFRTFVLQGGEDGYFSRDRVSGILYNIKQRYPDCAVTLSLGEHDYETYKEWFNAGADRYLLRHETATNDHYMKLHPPQMSLENRKQCLYQLKEIGYQVGAGFMVGSPFQTKENLVNDLLFLKELGPHMVGIGPFISHKETPFADYAGGTLEETLFLLSIIRLMLPKVLLPATTALGTINPRGREMGILAGANVVMPNLSPVSVRSKYTLYDNKICTGDEAAECIKCMSMRMKSIGYEVVTARGDYIE
ncbi:MAG: [FeFe] hydrogenase H-cluster radical SAM maturase HydE [Eubacterium sp.]